MKQENGKLRGWIAGLMLVALAPFAQANLVSNGGFETNDLNDSFTGWVVAKIGSGIPFVVGDAGFGDMAHTGVYSVRFYYEGETRVGQTFAQPLDTGSTYDVEFWLQFDDIGGFTATLDGQDLLALLTADKFDVNTGWTRYHGQLTANGANSALQFAGTGTSASCTGSFGRSDCTIYLDDVSVQLAAVVPPNPIPEPGSLALVGLGLAGVAALRRRKTAV